MPLCYFDDYMHLSGMQSQENLSREDDVQESSVGDEVTEEHEPEEKDEEIEESTYETEEEPTTETTETETEDEGDFDNTPTQRYIVCQLNYPKGCWAHNYVAIHFTLHSCSTIINYLLDVHMENIVLMSQCMQNQLLFTVRSREIKFFNENSTSKSDCKNL